MLGMIVGILFLFGFGGLLLIVVLGARRVDEERRARATREACMVVREPRFVVVAASRPEPRHGSAVDDSFFSQLQQYVEAEQLLADQFVLQPSIEALYRSSGRSLAH